MTSKSQNRSKTTYKGQNIRRLPRSELEDNTVRDLNRYDNRLDYNLRSVDKAREVMLKSLESDKHIFLRGGVRSNKKYTVPIQNPGDSRQRKEVTSQPSKYHPDTRNKKTSNDTVTQKVLTGFDVTNTRSKKNDDQDQSKHRDILAETREIIEKQSGDELVDDFLSNHIGTTVDSSGKTKKRFKSMERQSSRINQMESAMEFNQTPLPKPGYRSSTTPTIKIDDYDGSLSNIGQSDDKTNEGQKKTSSTSTQPVTYYDDHFPTGRKYDFWGYLSTPKNPSRSLQKREQLEREFSSPALKPRAATPATKSAKGPRSSTSYSSTSSTTATKSPTMPRIKSATQKKTTPTSNIKNAAKTPIREFRV